MTKVRRHIIRRHCAVKHFQQGFAAIAIFSMLKFAHLTPSSWGWDRLLAIAAGQLAGIALLLPVFFISTR